MDWEKEALKKIEKVPFFIKKRVKEKIEKIAEEHGSPVVTLEIIEKAQKIHMGGSGNNVKQETAGFMSSEHIRRVEELSDKFGVKEGRAFQVKLCGGASGCPLTLIDVEAIGEKIVKVIEASELDKFISEGIKGPLLSHFKFKAAVAGCSNCCSEPQIKDFGIVAKLQPKVIEEKCTGCQLCIKACKENAITLKGKIVEIDYSRCVNCGDCTFVCPREAIPGAQSGFEVMAGGKLGRHPRLASTIREMADEKETMEILDKLIDLMKEKGKPGERLGVLLEQGKIMIGEHL